MSGWAYPNAARVRRSAERCQALNEHIAKGQSIKGAARSAGISVRTATRYLSETR